MQEIHTYLTFNGNARQAMTFYSKCLGGKLSLMTFGDAGVSGAKNRIMHARITRGKAALMASDNMPGMKLKKGNNFSVSLSFKGVAEIEKVFKAFAKKGKVTMPLEETFWARRFGMLTDQFGVQWMFNLDK